MYKAVRTTRLYEQIVQQIEDTILSGAVKAGEQLPSERELATRFAVSRTAVREAVKTLSEKGLVEAYTGRGTFVTDATSLVMRQSLDRMIKIGQPEGSTYLLELREIFEPEIAALAALRVEALHLTQMREAIDIMDRSMRNPDAYIEADLGFHLALAEAAGNPLILSLLDSIVELLRKHRIRIFALADGPKRAQEHHKIILSAIEQRDPLLARYSMRAHLKQVREDSHTNAEMSDSGVGIAQ
jgi:GntR family transcriptional regulator, transcriptional repressor for pyruvate dehydrogenase complex